MSNKLKMPTPRNSIAADLCNPNGPYRSKVIPNKKHVTRKQKHTKSVRDY
jgi:hypothetical protein